MKKVVSGCVNECITCSPHDCPYPWGSPLHMTFSPCTCSFLTRQSATFPLPVYNFLSEVLPGPPPLGRGDLSSTGNVPLASSVVLFHSANCFVLKTPFFTRLWFVWEDGFFSSLKSSLPIHSTRSSYFLMSSLLFWPRSHLTASHDNCCLTHSAARPSSSSITSKNPALYCNTTPVSASVFPGVPPCVCPHCLPAICVCAHISPSYKDASHL